MIVQLNRLANGGRISKDSFPKEGQLPKQPGQQNTKYFYALKKIPIRAYGWYSERESGKFFISHYIYKDRNKLSEADTKRVGANWTRIEENGDER